MSFAIRVDMAAADKLFDGLAADAAAAARPAAQAMAQVFYDAVKANASGIRRHTGNLSRSIYQAYSADNSGAGRATYHISWNARKAPHGHLVEYGHLQRHLVTIDERGRWVAHKDKPLATPIQIAARPFIRPAMDRAEAARAAGVAEFYRRLGLT